MKKLQIQLKSIAKSLSALVKQVETVSKEIEKQKPAKAAAKKVVAKKAPAKKTAAKKVVAKKAPAKKATPDSKLSVIDTVKSLVARSRNGMTISALKEKTGFNSRQLSNALYKLAKRGKIASKARGLYVKK